MRLLPFHHRWVATLILTSLTFVIIGCSDDDGDSPPTYDLYVNMVDGSDSDAGTADAPFATITHALAAAEPGDRISVRPGLYNSASGESFPLRLAEGVELVGNRSGYGADTIIEGGGPSPVYSFSVDPSVTMVLGDDATVSGFTVLNNAPGNRIGIHMIGESVTLHRNTVRDIQPPSGAVVAAAIISTAGSNHRLIQNTVTGNFRAVTLLRSGDRTMLERNRIIGNRDGVTTTQRAYYYDFGGGELGSTGGNVFSCNEQYDVALWEGNVADMMDNEWDHAPPITDGGADIQLYVDEDETDPVFDVSGAVVAGNACQ